MRSQQFAVILASAPSKGEAARYASARIACPAVIESSQGLGQMVAAGAAAWNSVFPGSFGGERISAGRAFSTKAVGGYYLDYTPKTRGAGAAAPERLPSVGVIQLALGWWEGIREGSFRQTGPFLDSCEIALARAERGGDALLWPVLTAVAKYGLRPPWHSALVQGQAASIFVRAHQLTGDAFWGAAARAAVSPLLEPSGELVTATSWGPIFEEAPSTPASHILNGWISALWGVRKWPSPKATTTFGPCSTAAFKRFATTSQPTTPAGGLVTRFFPTRSRTSPSRTITRSMPTRSMPCISSPVSPSSETRPSGGAATSARQRQLQ